MSTPLRTGAWINSERHRRTTPPPGEASLVSAALAVGILLMGLQLWILTVALEEFQRHNDARIYLLAGISALIFVGGLAIRWLLKRTPSVRRTSVSRSRRSSPNIR